MVALATTFHPMLGVLLFDMGLCFANCLLAPLRTHRQCVSLPACQGYLSIFVVNGFHVWNDKFVATRSLKLVRFSLSRGVPVGS